MPAILALTLKLFENCGTGILPVIEHGQDGRATKWNAGFETASQSYSCSRMTRSESKKEG